MTDTQFEILRDLLQVIAERLEEANGTLDGMSETLSNILSNDRGTYNP